MRILWSIRHQCRVVPLTDVKLLEKRIRVLRDAVVSIRSAAHLMIPEPQRSGIVKFCNDALKEES